MKFAIPYIAVLSLKEPNSATYRHFYQSTKGLYALFSCRVACSEPQRSAPRSISSIRTPQAPCFIFEIRRCHYSTMFRNHKRSSHLASEKHLRFMKNLDVFLSARFILIIERRYLRKMSDKKQSKEASLSVTKIEQLLKQPIIESYVSKSEDGKWLIHKTTVTDIKPVSYFEKVLASN